MSLLLAASFLLASSANASVPTVHLRVGDFQVPKASPSQVSALQDSSVVVALFSQPAGPDFEARLGQIGFTVLRYLPDQAWVLRKQRPDADVERLFSLPGFEAVSRFESAWKMSPDVKAPPRPGSQVQWMISFFNGADNAAVEKQITEKLGNHGVLLSRQDNTVWVSAPIDAGSVLTSLEDVEWVQELPRFERMDFKLSHLDRFQVSKKRAPRAFTGYESGNKIIGADEAWSAGFEGEGEIASMADTGLDVGILGKLHPDFETIKKGLPLGLGSSEWKDPEGHGTHVAGSIVGTGKSSGGMVRGVAHKSQFVAESLWSDLAGGLVFGTSMGPLLKGATDTSATIHSNSWGNPQNLGVYDSFANQADDYMWKNPDLLVLFAAGNSGIDKDADGKVDPGSVSSPGTAKNVLTVGASENLVTTGGLQKTYGEIQKGTLFPADPIKSDNLSNTADGLAAFSSRGPTLDQRNKPDIVSPGTNILSVRDQIQGSDVLWGAYDALYTWSGGTSMATPITAGAAAVTREMIRKEMGISNPTGALVKAAMIHTAHDLFPGQYGTGPKQEIPTVRPNNQEGYGRTDLARLTQVRKDLHVFDQRAGLAAQEVFKTSVHAQAGATVRATMVYMDAPAAASAAKTLVNDLDLTVRLPDGSAKSLGDHVNNTEMVEFKAPSDGDYAVEVRASTVSQSLSGKQPFALVVSALTE